MTEHTAILFATPWTHPAEGWAIASRAYARAMKMGGLDVALHDWQRSNFNVDPEVQAEVAEFVDKQPAKISLHIFSSNLASAALMGVLDVMTKNPEPQAFYCVFERRYIEPELVNKLNRLAGVWVQCRMNERVLREAGVDNVTLIPYPFFDDDPHLELDKPTREPRHFYYIGRFEPRKAPDNIIRAFLRAFSPGEAELTLKVSPIPHITPYVTPWSTVDEELEGNKKGWTNENVWESIEVIEGMLSKEEMLELHDRGDVYVSASRGEGLELGAWAAKLAGRRLIVTASGGPEDVLPRQLDAYGTRDLCPDVDLVVPAKRLIPADACYPWGEGANYIDYDLDDLIAAMQKARSEPVCGTRIWPGWEKHRAPRVAEALRDWVGTIVGSAS